jgi:PKD repeat protein
MKPLALSKLSLSFLLIIAAACSKKDSAISTPPPSNQPPVQVPAPTAMFSFSNTDLRAPVAIKFSNTSQNADSYLWEFSDGTGSTEKEPQKVFAHDGSFSVKLTASRNGKTDVFSKIITIENAPNVMHITKFSVADIDMNGYDNFPESDSRPDVYLRLSSGGQSASLNTIQNANSPADLIWPTSLPIVVNRGFVLKVDVMDKDNFSSDDLMGSVEIRPEDYMTIDNRYPDVISKTVNGLTFLVDVDWQFSPR